MNVKIHDMTALLHGVAIHTSKYSTLGGAFQTQVQPQALPAPYWVCRNAALARELGLSEEWFDNHDAEQQVLKTLSGNYVPTGLQPTASVYSGHQFGQWAGQLGDGRALSLGQLENGIEIQLKGAGRTPYSRGGDGRAVLRSSIREFLGSEAMHGLGIATRERCASRVLMHRFTAKRQKPPPSSPAPLTVLFDLGSLSTSRTTICMLNSSS